MCAYCAVGCGIIFYKVGDSVIYVEGDLDNPINEASYAPRVRPQLAVWGAQPQVNQDSDDTDQSQASAR